MAGTLRYLNEKEIMAIQQFAGRLVDSLRRRVLHITLFGSKARGDFTSDSDLDLFVVLDTADWNMKDQVRFMAADVSLEYDVLLNTHILSQERWEEMVRHQATLWREVRRDGVPLMPERRDEGNESSHVLRQPLPQVVDDA